MNSPTCLLFLLLISNVPRAKQIVQKKQDEGKRGEKNYSYSDTTLVKCAVWGSSISINSELKNKKK